MVVCIIDSQLWIEYVAGSNQGALLQELFDNPKYKFITLECSLAEIKAYSLKHNRNFSDIVRLIKKNSTILPILQEHWLLAAEIRHEIKKKWKSFGLIDALIIARQKDLNCKLVSGDNHFKGLKNVIFTGD